MLTTVHTGVSFFFFLQFIKISGGLQGGAEPPAFQQAERRRMEKEEKEKKMRDSNLDNHHTYEKSGSIHVCHQLTFCLFTFFFVVSISLLTKKPYKIGFFHALYAFICMTCGVFLSTPGLVNFLNFKGLLDRKKV